MLHREPGDISDGQFSGGFVVQTLQLLLLKKDLHKAASVRFEFGSLEAYEAIIYRTFDQRYDALVIYLLVPLKKL